MADDNNSPMDLLDFGRVRFNFGGSVRELRCPSLAEFRTILQLMSKGSNKEDSSKPETTVDVTYDWLVEVFKILASEPLPSVDDLPPWLVNQNIPRQLLVHWQTIPV